MGWTENLTALGLTYQSTDTTARLVAGARILATTDEAEATELAILKTSLMSFNQSIAGKRHIEHGDYLKFLDETGFVPQ